MKSFYKAAIAFVLSIPSIDSYAEIYYVTQSGDPNPVPLCLPRHPCSLRSAIKAAELSPGKDTIYFNGDLHVDLNKDLEAIKIENYNDIDFLRGWGVSNLEIDAQHKHQIMHIVDSYVSIENVTFMGGYAKAEAQSTEFDGGALNISIYSWVTIANSIFTRNHSDGRGGAIHNDGMLNLFGSEVSLNATTPASGSIGGGGQTSQGGGIHGSGTSWTVIEHSVIHDNYSVRGGGIYNAGWLNVINSTIARNKAIRRGGGVLTVNSAAFQSSTIAENASGMDYNLDHNNGAITETTPSTPGYNAGGGGISAGGATGPGYADTYITLRNSIVAKNYNGYPHHVNDCYTQPATTTRPLFKLRLLGGVKLGSGSYDLGGTQPCLIDTSDSLGTNQVGTISSPVDPLFDSINGDSFMVWPLASGEASMTNTDHLPSYMPAISYGSDCPPYDQRGKMRYTQGCAIGAIEP